MIWPNFIGDTKFINIGSFHYAWSRMFMLFVGDRHRHRALALAPEDADGMVIRAGVDDRHMVSALGVNIQLTFAIGFMVGAALAGFGGAMGGSLQC